MLTGNHCRSYATYLKCCQMNIGVVTYCILTCIVFFIKILHSVNLPTVFVFVKNYIPDLCVKSKTKKNKSFDTKFLCFTLLLQPLAELFGTVLRISGTCGRGTGTVFKLKM